MFIALFLFILSVSLLEEKNPSDPSKKAFKNTDFLKKPFLIFSAILPWIILLVAILFSRQVRDKLRISLDQVKRIFFGLNILAFILMVYLLVLILIQPSDKINSSEQKWYYVALVLIAFFFDVIGMLIYRSQMKYQKIRKEELEKLRNVYDRLMSS